VTEHRGGLRTVTPTTEQGRQVPGGRRERSPGKPERAAIVLPGVLLGVGLGGFVDGIVLHQLLQWHHMVSNTDRFPTTTLAGVEGNTVGDGLFHVGAFAAVVAGLWLLARRTQRRPLERRLGALAGWMLVGWGAFDVVEGLIDHQLLQLHHVREGVAHEWLYDIAFLAFGAALIVAGLAWVRAAEARTDAPSRPRIARM
jgi:uncharacterized membrane protein